MLYIISQKKKKRKKNLISLPCTCSVFRW